MNKFQRDELIKVIYKKAIKNKKICILSADFGAPSLDTFREKLKSQFYHLGISEQNMINVAGGLAIEKNIAFTYAMAPFISLRCLEQHKINAMMNLPVINLVAGVGYGYANAGPTHYATEDYGVLKSIINSTIFTISDGAQAELIAKKLCEKPIFCFVRMDRDPLIDIENKHKTTNIDFNNGFRKIFNGKKLLIISHGFMLNKIYFILKKNKLDKYITIIDLFRSKPINIKLKNIINKYKKTITFDEQIYGNDLGSEVLTFINDNNIKSKLKNFSLKEKYEIENGGRQRILGLNGFSDKNILDKIKILMK